MSQLQKARRNYYRRKPVHQIIIAKGDEVHSFALQGWMIGAGIVAALGLTFWLFAATAYVMFRDDVLAGMIARQTRQQHAYEDRIAALRLQVDRVTSRQLLDQEAFTVRLDDLLSRQNMLQKRSSQVSALIDRARDMGVKLGDDDLITGSINSNTKFEPSARIGDTLASVDTELGRIGRYQESTLTALEQQMTTSEKGIRGAVAELGLSLDALAGKRKTAKPTAQGGPYIPLRNINSTEDFNTRASYVIDQMGWLGNLRKSLNILPVHRPLNNATSLSSSFGARLDPFTRRPAFHAGLDFRGNTGEPVKATASGTVTKAGRLGGYGNLVEVTHSNGFATRYGHLSKILVHIGQKVRVGEAVGQLGSTGRSSGPHLHYETRIANNAVNPMRFVRAGKKLNLW